MTSLTTTQLARGLLERDDLLQMLDRAVAKRVTVVSAPPGSGKTSLLRAWANRSTDGRRVAFVSVERDEGDAQRFWSAVLDAIRSPESPIDPETQVAATAELEGDEGVESVLAEVAEHVEPVVLIIDDLHELKSADALSQLERLIADLPSSARVVLSSRRDPPLRLHQLRLADEIADIRAGNLRFTERETVELLAASGISLSSAGAGALYRRTEGWAAGVRLAVISLSRHPDPERFVAEFSGTDRAIGEYLMAEMLDRQSSEVQSMLLRTALVGQEGAIAVLLRSFPGGASADHPELALAHAAVQLTHGQLEEAAAQLALAESHVQSTPPARRRRLAVAIASLRLALARRSGQFAEVIEQVNLLDTSVADESNEPAARGTELRGVALMNLGIVETWCRRFDDAERHLAEGAALAQAIGRPYLEVACRAHQVFPTRLVSLATARERGREAVALAERHGLGDRPILTPALGALAFWAIWTGEFDEGEHWLGRARQVAEPRSDPAAVVSLHLAAGMLHAVRGQQQSALEEFAEAAQAQSRLTAAGALATPSAGWLAATQARLGMPDEARATLAGVSAEPGRRTSSIYNARAV